MDWNKIKYKKNIYMQCSSAGKESTCSAGDLGLIPGLGRPPGEGKGYPLQYSGLENSMDCIVHGVAKSWTQLSDFPFQTVKTRLKWNWRTGNGRCRRALFYEAGEEPTHQQHMDPPRPCCPRFPLPRHTTPSTKAMCWQFLIFGIIWLMLKLSFK